MVNTLADVTLSTTATALSATSIRAAWVQIQGVTLTGQARVGDSKITTTRGGVLVAAGDAQFFPTQGNANAYDLSTIFVLGTNGDKVAVLYDTF